MPDALPCPCVLLLHRLPGGPSHLDWLTARTPDPGAALLAFRTTLRPDDPAVPVFSAQPLPDHRAFYLAHEGPLEPKDGRDRGDVRRLARGTALIQRADPERVELIAKWGGARRRYLGTSGAPRWMFSVTSA